MNIEISDVRGWNSLASVQRTLEAEFSKGHQIADNHVRFAIKQNQFLEMVEIPASDKFTTHFRDNIIQTTSCLLLLKSDYSEIMFVRMETGIAGNDVYRKYKISCTEPNPSDVARLKKLQSGNPTSFMGLFDTKNIVLSFYKNYKDILENLCGNISGIPCAKDRRHYSQLLLSRIMFIYFIQSKQFLANESTNYLRNRFNQAVRDRKNFYKNFLLALFFNVLNTERKNRETNKFDSVPFLNGGLFKKHPIEKRHTISIENGIFDEILKFLDGWMWYVDDTVDDANTTTSVNPEILGHIFETMIEDQNGQGAFYTPADITSYICRETIRPYCLDRVNEHFQTNYDSLRGILSDASHAEYLYFEVIKGIRVLDPSCGSGEFVLTAYKILYELYAETWRAIENHDTMLVRNEKRRLGSNPRYYFKRRIITENLYGVDIDDGALEVCKLRLWLSLVADMDRENAEPLPNIDYNIMQGDSLVGYITPQAAQQLSIDEPEHVSKILSEIEALKQKYRQEQEPSKAELLHRQIDEKVDRYNKRLNKAWISDVSRKFRKPFKIDVGEINPFHWILHFYNVVTSGGFDVVVGNPPWLSTTADVSSKTRRPKLLKPVYDRLFKTKDAREHYAFFFEIALNMMKPGGRIGYIVALSSISLKTKKPLQEFLMNQCSELKISSYNDRPGKIFEGGTHARSVIILGLRDVDTPCKIFTTISHRWKKEDRPSLLDRVMYLPSKNFHIGDDCSITLYGEGIIPKFGVEVEKSIMSKFLSRPRLRLAIKSKFVLWYHDTARYWVRVTDYKFKDSHVHPIYLNTERQKIVIMALLNSSLAYWFFNKTTNNKEISAHVKYLCVDFDAFSPADISHLRKLTNKLYRHYAERYRAREIKTDKVFCKAVIDEIDDILSIHYGFTKTELHYIKLFEAGFRIGNTAAAINQA